jgi:hypothetical protein
MGRSKLPGYWTNNSNHRWVRGRGLPCTYMCMSWCPLPQTWATSPHWHT